MADNTYIGSDAAVGTVQSRTVSGQRLHSKSISEVATRMVVFLTLTFTGEFDVVNVADPKSMESFRFPTLREKLGRFATMPLSRRGVFGRGRRTLIFTKLVSRPGENHAPLL
jgi:hypothetical protein